MIVRMLVGLGLVSALGAGAAAAQVGSPALEARSSTRGLTVGLDLSSVGSGVSAALGYGFSDRLTAFTRVGSESLAHADLGARYSFRTTGAALRPYVEAAGTALFGPRIDARTPGLGVTGALGAEYFVRSGFAVDVSLGATRGQFIRTESDESDPTGRLYSRGHIADRVRIGFRWHP